MEFNSIPFIFFINSILSLHHLLSNFCSHPLFSTIVTLYTLIILYVPSFFFTILLSPVLNSTGILLLSLLRLGANDKLQQESFSQELGIVDSCGNERLDNDQSSYLESRDIDHKHNSSTESRFPDFIDRVETHKEESKLKTDLGHACNQNQVEFKHDMVLESNSMESAQVIEGIGTKEGMESKKVDSKTMAFLEWNMRAPLEIIYEAYEGEEEDDDDDEDNDEKNEDFGNKQVMGCERYPSLSMCYPDSETNSSSSDDDFPINEKWETYESVFFKWKDEEEEREELIEISFDRYGKRSIESCHSEEDNLIEIDIFSTKS